MKFKNIYFIFVVISVLLLIHSSYSINGESGSSGPIVINLVSPYNNYFTDDDSVDFEWNVSNDSYCSIYINNELVDSTYCYGGDVCDDYLNINDLVNKWYVNCSGNISDVKTIIYEPYINTSEPKIYFKSANLSWNVLPGGYQYQCSLLVDNKWLKNKFKGSEHYSYVVNNLKNGWHNWKVECESPDKNVIFKSPKKYFKITVVKPKITLKSPDNNFVSYSRNVNFVWNTNKNMNCYLYIDSKEVGSTYCYGNSDCSIDATVNDGYYLWFVKCEDKYGQVGYSENRSIVADVAPPGFVNAHCSHGGTRKYQSTTYNMNFNKGSGSGYGYNYIVPIQSSLSVNNIAANNYLCSNGARGSNIPMIVLWVYKYGTFVNSYSNGFKFSHELTRNKLIGPSSSTEGYKPGGSYTWNSGGLSYVTSSINFDTEGKYTIYSDEVNAICNSPLFICPDLQGTWRSTVCDVGDMSTPNYGDGWRPITTYKILAVDFKNLKVNYDFSKDNVKVLNTSVTNFFIINHYGHDSNVYIKSIDCPSGISCKLISPKSFILHPYEVYPININITIPKCYIGYPKVNIYYNMNGNLYHKLYYPGKYTNVLIKFSNNNPIPIKVNMSKVFCRSDYGVVCSEWNSVLTIDPNSEVNYLVGIKVPLGYTGWPDLTLNYTISNDVGYTGVAPKRYVEVLSPVHFSGTFCSK